MELSEMTKELNFYKTKNSEMEKEIEILNNRLTDSKSVEINPETKKKEIDSLAESDNYLIKKKMNICETR